MDVAIKKALIISINFVANTKSAKKHKRKGYHIDATCTKAYSPTSRSSSQCARLFTKPQRHVLCRIDFPKKYMGIAQSITPPEIPAIAPNARE